MSKFDKDVKGQRVCVVDGEIVKEGYKVNEEDVVIKLIRRVKSRFSHLKNNSLYVCPSHYDFYMKKRKSYERIVLIVSILIAAIFFTGIVFPLFSGTLTLPAIVSFVSITFLMSIILVFFHIPSVSNKLEKFGKSGNDKKTKNSKKGVKKGKDSNKSKTKKKTEVKRGRK